MGTIKSGTLQKQEGLVWKEWKSKYCVLYADGEFSMYQNAADATAETRIFLKSDVRNIETGRDCGSVSLPKQRSNDVESLFAIFADGKKTHFLLASNTQECREWVLALDRIIANPISTKSSMVPPMEPPPYTPSDYRVHDQFARADPPNRSTRPQSSTTSQQPPVQQPSYNQQPMAYPQQPMYGAPMYGAQQPMMYGPPMYGQPMMYGQQPVYVQQAPQPQQQSRGSNTGGLLLAGGGGLLGGYMLGSMMSDMNHHHHYDHGGGYDHGGFDHGGGDFDGGGFDF